MSSGSDLKIIRVEGKAVPLEGNDVDTDRIIPARFLKEITFTNMGKYPFYDERFETDGTPKPHPFNDPRHAGASLLFVESNFGCGSSREHAPQALRRWGVRAVVGVSFAEIFAGNCTMLGVPAVTVSAEDSRRLIETAAAKPETRFLLDLEAKTLSGGGLLVSVDLPESRRRALLDGTWDSTGMLLSNASKARKVAEALPYVRNFERDLS